MRYADSRCKIFSLDNRYVITGNCVVTGKEHRVEVPAPELFAYRQGAHIQDAMPSVSSEDREFLMSGTSPEGWKKIFGSEEE